MYRDTVSTVNDNEAKIIRNGTPRHKPFMKTPRRMIGGCIILELRLPGCCELVEFHDGRIGGIRFGESKQFPQFAAPQRKNRDSTLTNKFNDTK